MDGVQRVCRWIGVTIFLFFNFLRLIRQVLYPLNTNSMATNTSIALQVFHLYTWLNLKVTYVPIMRNGNKFQSLHQNAFIVERTCHDRHSFYLNCYRIRRIYSSLLYLRLIKWQKIASDEKQSRILICLIIFGFLIWIEYYLNATSVLVGAQRSTGRYRQIQYVPIRLDCEFL